MGRGNAKRRGAFFKEHPFCCFCGGATPAVEEDHFPSRALFLRRAWPEGYAFPACKNCNHVTQHEESVVAFLARARSQAESKEHIGEFAKYMRDIARYFPGLIESMNRISHRELRDARKQLGVTLQLGMAHTDLPLLSVADPRFQDSVLSFGRKLGLAFYYKPVGTPVPAAGGVAVRWYSNIQVESDAIPRELDTVLRDFPPLIRAGTTLSDQFFYRFGVADEKTIAVYLAMFRLSFAALGFVATEMRLFERLPSIDAGGIFPVYSWSSEANQVSRGNPA